MGNIMKFEQLFENKMWYKTIPEILGWLESKADMPWLWTDTETTGLGGPKQQQLTQVSSLAAEYDFASNTFRELDVFDEKIKLTDEIKARYAKPGDESRKILSFNRYGTGGYSYKEEQAVVDSFFDWMGRFSPCLLVAQNAGFDMSMLAGRSGHKISNEVFDTKMLIQLYYLPLVQTLAETDDEMASLVNQIGTSSRDNGLISSSMAKIGPALGMNMVGHHDAITDCRLTIEMFRRIVDILKSNQGVDIMKYQAERIKVIRSQR